MSDAGEELVDEATRRAEVADSARIRPDAGQPPSPAEDAAADRAADSVDTEAVADPYRDMTRKGAEAEGEGRLP